MLIIVYDLLKFLLLPVLSLNDENLLIQDHRSALVLLPPLQIYLVSFVRNLEQNKCEKEENIQS